MVDIYMLGEFKIVVDGVEISNGLNSSPKKIILLEMLIINHEKPVSLSNLIDVLWGDNDAFGLEGTLKTLVSRLRKELSGLGLEDAIVTRRGAYMWNPDLKSNIDVFRMEELCKRAKKATSLTPSLRENFEEILFLYKDDLLVNSALSSYIAPKVFHYRDLYISAMYQYIKYLNASYLYGDVIRVCKASLEIDPFESMLNLELMRALLKMGHNKEALTQYQNITKLHYTHLGMKPSEEILDFYSELIKQDHNSEASIEQVCNDLKQSPKERGAFVCEYTIFKDIYHLHMRNLERLGATMYLAVLSLRPIDNSKPEPLEIDKSMTNLLDILQKNLRSGDTIARCSATQYAALLPNIATSDVGNLVLGRLKQAFYSDTQNTKFVLDYKLVPLTGTSN